MTDLQKYAKVSVLTKTVRKLQKVLKSTKVDNNYSLSTGRGHCAVDGILPFEAILLSPFMCKKISIFATILVVMLQCSG